MARPKLGNSPTVRIQMVLTQDELDAIDVWQHENGIATRSEAIRRMAAKSIADATTAKNYREEIRKLWFAPVRGLQYEDAE